MNTSKRFSLSRYVLSAILILIPVCMFAGNNSMIAMQDSIQQTDSIDKIAVTDLQEYVVQGRNAFYKDGVLTVIPTEREKSYASDGNELLRFLQIPQLIYDFRERKISHMGGNLAMYINGVAATDADIRNLKTTDVQKVEYMDYPQDPRYGFNAHVVNFVVQKYQYGGYTRLKSSGSLTYFYNNSSLYSKFNINDLTIDAYVSYRGGRESICKDDKEFTYSFKDLTGNQLQLTETQKVADSDDRFNKIPVTLRIQLVKPKYIISNTIGYSFQNIPKSTYIYDTEYSGIYSELTKSEYNRNYHENTLSWDGSYQFFLPKNWFLSFSPRFSFGHYNDMKTNNAGLEDLEEVIFKTKENNSVVGIHGTLAKKFASGHNLQALARIFLNQYNIDYLGTSISHVKMKALSMVYNLGYSFNRSNLRVGVNGGLSYARNSSNGIDNSEKQPFITAYAQYNPNSKHSLSLTINYQTRFTEANKINPDVIQISNFMYSVGNPNIRNIKHFSGMIIWNWIPINLLRIGISADYICSYNNQASIYTPYNNGTGILRTFTNNGNKHMFLGVLSLSLNNLANCLSITLRPGLSITNETGYYAHTLTTGFAQIYLDCFLKNGFNIFAMYSLPSKRYNCGETMKLNHNYDIGANWSYKNLHISLTFSNFFGINWSSKKKFVSDCYSYTTEYKNINDRGNIDLSISYLFSYGKKKISKGDEIDILSGPGSGAISF